MQGDDTFSEGDGTVECCFAISGLPDGGLGCDIVVTVQSLAVGGTMDASMHWTFIVILCLIFCFFLTAAVGSDYALLMTTATFESGMTSNGDNQCIQIDIMEDDIYEQDEIFIFRISSVTPSSAAVIGSPMQVTKTIQDNAGRISVEKFLMVDVTDSLTDAMVHFVSATHRVDEEAGSVYIYVDSNVTEGFEADLVVSLMLMDGKAGEKMCTLQRVHFN